jgi:predicted transcriptional regulator
VLARLTEKGFLTSERAGRERNYTPAISKQDYMRVETESFMARHYINSPGGLIKTFYDGQDLSGEDIKDLQEWLAARRRRE